MTPEHRLNNLLIGVSQLLALALSFFVYYMIWRDEMVLLTTAPHDITVIEAMWEVGKFGGILLGVGFYTVSQLFMEPQLFPIKNLNAFVQLLTRYLYLPILSMFSELTFTDAIFLQISLEIGSGSIAFAIKGSTEHGKLVEIGDADASLDGFADKSSIEYRRAFEIKRSAEFRRSHRYKQAAPSIKESKMGVRGITIFILFMGCGAIAFMHPVIKSLKGFEGYEFTIAIAGLAFYVVSNAISLTKRIFKVKDEAVIKKQHPWRLQYG